MYECPFFPPVLRFRRQHDTCYHGCGPFGRTVFLSNSLRTYFTWP